VNEWDCFGSGHVYPEERLATIKLNKRKNKPSETRRSTDSGKWVSCRLRGRARSSTGAAVKNTHSLNWKLPHARQGKECYGKQRPANEYIHGLSARGNAPQVVAARKAAGAQWVTRDKRKSALESISGGEEGRVSEESR